MNRNNKELLKKVGIGASHAILFTLFLGAAVVAPGGVAGTLKVIEEIIEGKKVPLYEQNQIDRALRYLKSRKLIHIQMQYQKEVFSLTKLGYFRTKKLLKSFCIQKPKKWDGKWRMVVFDIPVSKKNTADLFRNQLKNLGLANLQKSIWIHPYDCRDQVYYLAGNLFIKPYVRYIVAEEVTGEQDLKNRFGI